MFWTDTICQGCGKVVPVAPGHCLLCGAVIDSWSVVYQAKDDPTADAQVIWNKYVRAKRAVLRELGEVSLRPTG